MKNLFAATMLLSATIAPMQAAQAATVVDQSQPLAYAGFSYLSQTSPTAQTFVPTATNSVGAGIFMSPEYGSIDMAPITISLWTGTPQNAASIMLATANVFATRGQWVDATWNAVSIVAGDVYNLRLTGNDEIVVAYGAEYTFGEAYFNGNRYNSYDLAFRTFADDGLSVPGVGGVPEPASWAMMIGGFGLVGGAMRRRNNLATKFA